MKSEINAMSGTIAIEAPLVRLTKHRNAGRSIGLTPLPRRAFPRKDSYYLRTLRRREMKSWIAAGRATPPSEETQLEATGSRVSQTAATLEQKCESALLAILTVTAAAAVGSILLDPAQLVSCWATFLEGVRNLLS
jgi:hypothetical protein